MSFKLLKLISTSFLSHLQWDSLIHVARACPRPSARASKGILHTTPFSARAYKPVDRIARFACAKGLKQRVARDFGYWDKLFIEA